MTNVVDVYPGCKCVSHDVNARLNICIFLPSINLPRCKLAKCIFSLLHRHQHACNCQHLGELRCTNCIFYDLYGRIIIGGTNGEIRIRFHSDD